MLKKIVRVKSIRHGLAWILLGLIVTVATGCNWRALYVPSSQEPGWAPLEAKKYAEAVSAYKARTYNQSIQRFTALREQTANPVMARMALYGLACARLMRANTPAEYQEALDLWETWVQGAPKKPEHEDPALLAPILAEKMLFSNIPLDKEASVASGDLAPSVPKWLLVRANQEVQRLKSQAAATEQNLETRDKKIKALEKEIERLNAQIKAFESIDQKIQKKKNAIPSAD